MDGQTGRSPPNLQDLSVVVCLRVCNLLGLSSVYTFADGHSPARSALTNEGLLNSAAVPLPLWIFRPYLAPSLHRPKDQDQSQQALIYKYHGP